MLTCYSLVNHFKLRLLYIFVSALIIRCDERNNNDCPLIETLSFGSDIDIKCNNTYLIFNEINNKKLNWKFANQSLFCHQQQGFLNQCNITQINSKYLKVPLKSLDHNELACIYCPINYKPIAPMIIVTRSDDSLYTFNLTATGLAQNESFEILWAKRAGQNIRISYNYWFLKRYIHHDINVRDNTGHSIIFTTDDIYISRVEFIIRRCSSNCRTYQRCDEREFHKEISLINFQIPDSIEKISCDYDCLNGIVRTTTTPTTIDTIHLSNEKPTIKFIILFPILGLLIVLLFIILGCFIISRIKGVRTESVYTKTSNINLDENKENVE